jgi:hypothetical protein
VLQIDPTSAFAIQPELVPGEALVWAGQPKISVIFHQEDALLIPVSLLWGGFAIFWEAGVSGIWGTSPRGPWTFGMLLGIPFVLAGQYLIWGRFFYAAWLKKRTHYAVTNRRVIVVQDGWRRQIAAAYLDSLRSLVKDGGSNGFGILRFDEPLSMWADKNQRLRRWNEVSIQGMPRFVDIEDVDSVYRLVSDLRERARTAK